MSLKTTFKDSAAVSLPFLAGILLYTTCGTLVYILYGKEGAHALLNAYHTPYLDTFFSHMTHAGHGLITVAAFVFLLLARYSWALAMGISSLVVGAVVQTLKRSVFAGDHRPAMFFEEGGLPTVEGVELMLHHSFPSGHSATACCFFLLMAFFVKRSWATYLFGAAALLVAFSRVYISQHFVQDTIAGLWIGFLCGLLGHALIVGYADSSPHSKLNGRLWP